MLREMRVGLQLSQTSAAYLAGIYRTSLVKMETGARGVGIVNFCRIADTYRKYTRQYYPLSLPGFERWLEELMEYIADSYLGRGARVSV